MLCKYCAQSLVICISQAFANIMNKTPTKTRDKRTRKEIPHSVTWKTNRKVLTEGSNICNKEIYIQQTKQRLKLKQSIS